MGVVDVCEEGVKSPDRKVAVSIVPPLPGPILWVGRRSIRFSAAEGAPADRICSLTVFWVHVGVADVEHLQRLPALRNRGGREQLA